MFQKWLFLLFALLLVAGQAHAWQQAEKPQTNAGQTSEEAINSLIQQQRYDEAIALLEDALKREPQSADLNLLLAKSYFVKGLATNNAALEAKAFELFRKSIELAPQRADLHYSYAKAHLLAGHDDEAIAECDRAIKLDAVYIPAYTLKWKIRLKRPNFEAEAQAIRAEIGKLLAENKSEPALAIAAKGFEMLADDPAIEKIYDRVLSEYPKGNWAQNILAQRAFEEPDNDKRADLLDAFITRYPADPRAALVYQELFRLRVNQPATPAARLAAIGDAWIERAPATAYAMIVARAKVALALAERRSNLGRAETLANDAVKIAKGLTADSPLVAGEQPADREPLIARLKLDAQMALGFAHLRQGRIPEAAKELSAPLEPVTRQVERDGFVLWRDADLRELGLPPRVLWLAELYEVQGDYEKAAKYLLAGVSDEDYRNRIIQTRLPAVYSKLGRTPQDAAAAFDQAAQHFRMLTTPTTAARDQEKRQLLATRGTATAPDFKATRLDKKEVGLADLKGKVAVISFWATWCGPCLIELPRLQDAAKKYAANPDVIFLAISVDEHKLAVRPFVERKGYRFPVAYDINGAEAFGVSGIPTLIILDRRGRVAFREQGIGGDPDHYIERLSWRIDELLNEKADSEKTGQSNE
ncbi:MAG TPA: redoxin domain-containing protein [Blastocatellia bacterium]|nr:redoxin domain-containing protein [Blastocatellia bacterium]